MLDADHNGYLDFKEFQQAIDLVGARLPDDRLRWSFRLYDMDNSGSIALNEMEGVFDCIYNMFEVWNTLHNGKLGHIKEQFKSIFLTSGRLLSN